MSPILKFLDNVSSTKYAYLIIVIFALAVYSKSFSCGFVNFDDNDYIHDYIHNLATDCANYNPFEAPKQKAKLNFIYRPITIYTYILDYLINGENPKSYHVTNLIIHALTCMGLLLLLKTLGFDGKLSFLMTLLFTVHPLFNQTVAWIPPRADLLMALFGILSVITLIKFFEENRWLYVILHLATFTASLFSKESAILFPIVYVLFFYFMYYCKHKNKCNTGILPVDLRYNFPYDKFINIKNLTLLVGWILIIGLFLHFRSIFVRESLKSELIVGVPVFLSNIWVVPEFIAKFFIPIKLSGLPQFSVLISSIGILIMAGMTIMAKINSKDLNHLSFIGIAWFLIFTAVTMISRQSSGYVSFNYLEHRTYLPSMGLIIFIMSFNNNIWKVRLIYVLIPLIFIYSAYSFVNINKFKSPIAFYNSIIDDNANVAIAYNNRGIYKGGIGDKQGAIEDYNKAISVKYDCYEAYYNKANTEYELKNNEIAIGDYTKAIKFKPNFADAYLKRGSVFYERGLIKQNNGDKQGAFEDYLIAIDDYTKGVEIKAYPGAYSDRGDIYLKINRKEDAIADYNRAIKLDPKYSGAYNNLGIVYAIEGNYLESIKYFTKAIEYDSKFGKAYMNRGLAYLYLGNKQKACEDFKLSMGCGSEEGRILYEKYCR